jgi:hypothetical protein
VEEGGQNKNDFFQLKYNYLKKLLSRGGFLKGAKQVPQPWP